MTAFPDCCVSAWIPNDLKCAPCRVERVFSLHPWYAFIKSRKIKMTFRILNRDTNSSNVCGFVFSVSSAVYMIKLGTLENESTADVEWRHHAYTRTAKKRKVLSVEWTRVTLVIGKRLHVGLSYLLFTELSQWELCVEGRVYGLFFTTENDTFLLSNECVQIRKDFLLTITHWKDV